MSCTENYSNCVEITSDKCVRYTGTDVPDLGIESGDSLLSVEQKIIEKLLSALDGSAVTFDMGAVCDVIAQYLPNPEQINLDDIVKALVQAVCEMNTKLEEAEQTLDNITANYTLGCLGDISQNVHSILQATINKACATATDLASFKTSVKTNYVKVGDLNTLIQQYLDTH